ncbi:MAG: putative hydrolase of the superfamily [Ilumatobacteraceae bacterium]
MWQADRLDQLGVVMRRPAVKNRLLDIGGPVLLTPFELVDKAEQTLGAMPWRGPFDHASDHEYVRWQRGEITERDYWTVRADAYGLDIHGLMRHFYEPAGDYLVRPEMVDLIIRHRAAGRIVGVLTNDMNAFHGAEWKDGISVIKEFDFIVDGSITGYLKPDPRAFRLALDAFGNPDPASVVFVDDQRSNLRGAEAVGITTVFFDPTDPTGSLELIEAALI